MSAGKVRVNRGVAGRDSTITLTIGGLSIAKIAEITKAVAVAGNVREIEVHGYGRVGQVADSIRAIIPPYSFVVIEDYSRLARGGLIPRGSLGNWDTPPTPPTPRSEPVLVQLSEADRALLRKVLESQVEGYSIAGADIEPSKDCE